MSIATYSSGAEEGNSLRKDVRFRSFILFLAHAVRLRTVSATSAAIRGQNNRLRIDLIIRDSSG
jgi:hypothetical protein